MNYFRDTIVVGLADDLKVYLICRLVNPVASRTCLKPEHYRDFRRAIEAMDYFSESAINGMVLELPEYRRLHLEHVPHQAGDDKRQQQMSRSHQFWREHGYKLDELKELAKYCFSIAPSSAAAERVFSILKSHFTKQQLTCALEDYTETAVMLAYNKDNYA
jgi:hypothetical protein